MVFIWYFLFIVCFCLYFLPNDFRPLEIKANKKRHNTSQLLHEGNYLYQRRFWWPSAGRSHLLIYRELDSNLIDDIFIAKKTSVDRGAKRTMHHRRRSRSLLLAWGQGQGIDVLLLNHRPLEQDHGRSLCNHRLVAEWLVLKRSGFTDNQTEFWSTAEELCDPLNLSLFIHKMGMILALAFYVLLEVFRKCLWNI